MKAKSNSAHKKQSKPTQIQQLLKEFDDNRAAIITLGREIEEKKSQMKKLLDNDTELYYKIQELHANEVIR